RGRNLAGSIAADARGWWSKGAGGRLQLTLRIDQEVGRGHDRLMRQQTLQHNKIVSDAGTDRDFLRLQASVAMIQEDQLPRTRLKHCRGGNHKLPSQAALHDGIHEHSWLEL